MTPTGICGLQQSPYPASITLWIEDSVQYQYTIHLLSLTSEKNYFRCIIHSASTSIREQKISSIGFSKRPRIHHLQQQLSHIVQRQPFLLLVVTFGDVVISPGSPPHGSRPPPLQLATSYNTCSSWSIRNLLGRHRRVHQRRVLRVRRVRPPILYHSESCTQLDAIFLELFFSKHSHPLVKPGEEEEGLEIAQVQLLLAQLPHQGELPVVLAIASITVGWQLSEPHGRVGQR